MLNIDLDFEVKAETAKAFLLCKDGKEFWVKKQWVNKEGNLTPAGEKAFQEAQTKEEKGYIKVEIVSETEKAVKFAIRLWNGLNDFSKEFFAPKSLVKEGKLPTWFINKKIEEIQPYYNVKISIL